MSQLDDVERRVNQLNEKLGFLFFVVIVLLFVVCNGKPKSPPSYVDQVGVVGGGPGAAVSGGWHR